MAASSARKQRAKPRQPRLKPWLNSTEAAEYLGVHSTTLARWRELRTGPVFQRYATGPVRYARAELDAYLNSTRHGGDMLARAEPDTAVAVEASGDT